MKLYFASGFTSLADHIAILEAGIQFDVVKVDIATKQIEGGGRYMDINPTGYVPALVFDDGEVLTENVAILRGAAELGFPQPEPLRDYITRIERRPAVKAVLHREGLA